METVYVKPAYDSRHPRPLGGLLLSATIGIAFVADRVLGDPRRFHPVAGFGRAAGALEPRIWRDDRGVGVVYAVLLVGGAYGTTRAIESRLRGRARLAFGAATIWATLGGRSLELAAIALADALAVGDLHEARRLARTLVGRDPSELDEAELARAAVESVAENTSDAVVAPLLWAALLGPSGAAAYRAANTLDAMVGHRDPHHVRFGWASARLDDLMNLLPARLTVALTALCAPLVHGRSRQAWRAARRDGPLHPSPNAGRVEAAFAGALDLRLGGRNRYAHGIEERARLGHGLPPRIDDIARAIVLARLVGLAAAALAVVSGGAMRR